MSLFVSDCHILVENLAWGDPPAAACNEGPCDGVGVFVIPGMKFSHSVFNRSKSQFNHTLPS